MVYLTWIYYGAQIDATVEHGITAADLADLAVSGLRMRFDDVVRDLVYALRRLQRAPLFVSIVVLTFALGIGANVAVFSVLNAVVLKPLPFEDAGRIVMISGSDKGTAPVWQNLSFADPLDMRGLSAFEATAAIGEDGGTMLAGSTPFAVSGFDVMPEYFRILDVRAQLGRVLERSDSNPGVHDIVISDRVWRADFAGDPNVVGETVRLNGVAQRIVGVLRPDQPSLSAAGGLVSQDYYGALPEHAAVVDRGERYFDGIALLAPGVTVERANAQLALLSQRLRGEYPRIDFGWLLSVASSRSVILGQASSVLWIVFTAVIGILVIACASVGNMLGARWSTRDRELAVRRALRRSASTSRGCSIPPLP